MKPIQQTIIAKSCEDIPGDCLRAGIASLFELDIIQVPHFLMYKDRWFYLLHSFFWFMGFTMVWKWYEKEGCQFSRKHLVNGCIMASVPSRTFKTGTHLVLINSRGRVLHDPNPNKKWLGCNIVESKEIRGWYCLEKRSD